MGLFYSQTPENPELTTEKIYALEQNIWLFIKEQEENIKNLFNDESYVQQNIEYKIDEQNNNIIKENENPLKAIEDYSIQWSIQGNNKINSTNCHLTFFNIGALLGDKGLLYIISQFYYFFSKIPTENRENTAINRDIETCLNYIDSGNIQELNIKWRTNLNEDSLMELRMAKDFLINLFHEKITSDIFDKISNNLFSKIIGKCKSFFNGVSRIIAVLSFFFPSDSQNKCKEENEYLKRKNAINKYHLPKILLKNINLEFFSKNNIFILASDDNTIPLKNLGVAFVGGYINGLGEMGRARKLIENDTDGFWTGTDSNNNNKTLYKFYYDKINEIDSFFERNRDIIERINKGMNSNDEYYIDLLAKQIDEINKNNLNGGIIDRMYNNSFKSSTIYSQNTQYTQYTQNTQYNPYNHNNCLNQGSLSYTVNSPSIYNINDLRENLLLNNIREQDGEERALECKNIMSKQLNNIEDKKEENEDYNNFGYDNDELQYKEEEKEYFLDNN